MKNSEEYESYITNYVINVSHLTIFKNIKFLTNSQSGKNVSK